MGLIKAISGATGGVLADQWREYFYCEALEADVLAAKGCKRTSARRSTNKNAEDNIITNGSIIAVNDGQCMIIVEQGKVVEVCAEPGEFTWDSSTEPSIFVGKLGESIIESFKTIGKRFTFGGDTAKDQRIYYFNTKEIIGNKYGTTNAVPFRVVDKNVGLDIDISVRCFGEYSYRIADPILFYTNVCGNIESEYRRDAIDSQLRAELLTALQPAFAKISAQGVRYSEVPGHTEALAAALNEELTAKWQQLRGLVISSFAVSSIKASEEDEAMIKELQRNAAFRDPHMAAAHLTGATAAAMQAAAANEGAGAFMGLAGMNMAAGVGGAQIGNLFAMEKPAAPTPAAPAAPANSWACTACQQIGNTSNFCSNCGAARPASNSWNCPSCNNLCGGKFCANCGTPKPAEVATYKCDKCGWLPQDPQNPPKFCPNCGDPFTAADKQ
ncbi:MAG: SPFH domain-containing protein [Firmicutes bacterium]|nr:SPFH domain-containing protein [Bacillota bacterium]MBR7112908.1 SPFH domain-containing protein [Bacillota bacterium]